MPEPKLSQAQFAEKLKSKYPQYAGIDDVTLIDRVLQKYPQYGSIVDLNDIGEEVKKKEFSEVSVLRPTEGPSASDTSTSFMPKGEAPLDTKVPEAFKTAVSTPKFEPTKAVETKVDLKQDVTTKDWWADKWNGLIEGVQIFAANVSDENNMNGEAIADFIQDNKTKKPELFASFNNNLELLKSKGYDDVSGRGMAANIAYTDFWRKDNKIEDEVLPYIRQKGREKSTENFGIQIDEKVQKELGDRFFSSAVRGLATSTPAMLTSASTMGMSFFNMSYNNAEEQLARQLAENPNLNMTSGERETYKVTNAGIEAVLERVGLSNALRGNPMLKRAITGKVLTRLAGVGDDVGAEAFEKIVKQEVKGLAGYARKVAAGSISEFETGALQQLSNDLINQYVTDSQGKNIFSPKTTKEIITDVLYAGAQEAVGGGIISGAVAPFQKSALEMTKQEFESGVDFAKKVDIQKVSEYLNKQVETGKITEGQASQTLDRIQEFNDLSNKLPEDISKQGQYELFQLIAEKQRLQKSVVGKDEVIQQTITEDVNAINQRIKEVYDTQKEAGVPSPVAEGQAPIEAQPVEGAGQEATPADRVLQAREKLILESVGMDATLQAVERGDEVEQSDVEAAQERILQVIDDVDKSDIPVDAKQAYIQTLEDKFDELEYYDNKTITTTEQVTEEVPIGPPRAGSRTVVEPEVQRGKFRLFERLNNLEVAVGTETEGQTSVIETQEDGSIDVVTYDKSTKQEVSRQPKVAENILGLEYVESIFDADGNLTGVVMRPKTPKGEDISPVRIQVVNRPELALDIAIDARKKEIGTVPDVIWMQEYETVTREVTTKERVPAAKRPERKAARVVLPTEAVATEQVTEQVVEQEPTKNKKGLTSEQVTEAVSAAKRLSKRLGLPTKIIAHNSRKEFNDAMDEVSKSGSVASGVESGRFIPSRNEIHLNLEDMTSEVPFHEVFHAAFVNRFGKASQATREKTASDFQSGLLRVLRSGTAEDQQLADAVERFVKDGEYSAKESSEEFMAQTAGFIATSGKKISKTTMDKLIQWMNNFIGKISPSFKVTTRGEFIDFMNSFSGALFEASIDDQTYTGLESEVTTSIPSVSESSSRQGKDASYVNRTFDKEKIQFADLSEYVGKPAITYAMDLAVTGTVKSPTGVTYTFDGGVFYPLLGEGGWAFTDEKTAKRILSKLKKFDGRVLLMSQDSRGIRGNFQFWGYMLDEVNKAVKDKRATEAELVEYINSKLKKKPIQAALAEKGLPLQIKKLSELNNLMPNDGTKKVGYEVRAEFNEALFSAEANKRFGLPRIEAILEYVNEPLLANAQYGDLVAVLEFDPAKMDVKDSRKIKDAKVHPAYPWIITGFKDLKILNEFVDVRNVFGDYRSKMAEEKGDPELKKRIKIRAARAVVTGGASANNLKINDNIVKSILGIAPYRAKYVNEISEARDEYKKPSFERFINAFNNIAKKFDVQVYGIEKTIGGWYDSELNSVTQEVSMRPTIAGNREDILAMSAVAGIMAPVKKEDFQNGVMIVEYKTGGKSEEVTFKVKSDAAAKRIIDSLNDYGFGGGFTYVPSDKSFHLAMIPYDDVELLGLRNNLENLVTFAKSNNLIDEKSIQYYQAEVNFPGSDRESDSYYGRILQEARDSKRYEKDGREGALKLLNQALEILDERNNAIDSELSESSSIQVNKAYDELLESSSKQQVQLGIQQGQINYDIDKQLAESSSWQERERSEMERYMDLARIKIQDKLYGVIKLQEDIEYSTGKPVGLDQDFRNAEVLMHGKAASDLTKSMEKAEKVVEDIKSSGVTLDAFDQLLYALHAQERNRVQRIKNTDIPKSIKDLRDKNNLKPMEVAEMSGIDIKTYRDLESGTAKKGITSEELNKILSVYGMSPSQFYTQYTTNNAGSGMTDIEAQTILSTYGLDPVNPDVKDLKPALRDAVNGVYEIIADSRERMLEYGLETLDTVVAFESMYNNYVPLQGFEGEDSASEIIDGGRSIEIRERQKRALGRKSKADSPFLTAVAQNQSTIVRARKNEVAQKLYRLAETNPNDQIWKVIDPAVNKEYKKNPTVNGIKYVAKTISDYLIKPENFSVRIDGEYKFVQFTDPRMAEALRGANVVKADFIVKYLGGFNRLLSSFITTYDPEFVLRNFSRDIQVAVINAVAEQEIEGGLLKGKDITGKIVKSVPKSIKAIFNMSKKGVKPSNEFEKYYADFLEDGAKTEWFYSKSIDELRNDVDKLVNGKGNNAIQAAGNFVERINTSVENGVRLAAYMEARKAGLSRDKAAELAKNLTVNFNKSGEWGTVANSLYLFFNASVQGTSRLVRTLKPQFKKNDDGTRSLQVTTAQKIAISMFIAGSLMSLFNEALSDDDEDGKSFYSKIPDFEKERNIIIMIPKSLKLDTAENYIKIPLPYGLNVFYVAGNAMADAGQGIKTVGEVATNILQAAVGSFSPINFPSSEDFSSWIMKFITPTVGQIPLSLALNEDYFGRTIYNKNFPTDSTPKPDSELGRKRTTEMNSWIAKELNKLTGGSELRSGVIDINPDKIDFFLETLSGGAGRFALRSTSTIGNLITGNWDQIESNDVPGLRVFYGQPRKFVDLQSYFDKRIEVNQFMEEVKAGDITGPESSRIREVYRINRAVDKSLRNLRKAEKTAENIEDPEQREDRLNDIERKRYAQIANFQKAYEKYKIDKL